MTEQLIEIGGRLKALRDIMDIPAKQMAQDLRISVAEYLAYERGELDFSFSVLYNAANILGVDHVSIIRGESPKLSKCALIRSGKGFPVDRESDDDYKHLAYTFKNRSANPYLVTVVPKEQGAESIWHTHPGQEFNYMVSGRMEFRHSDSVYQLEAGDSLYFDSGIPHTMQALDGAPATFVAVVMK